MIRGPQRRVGSERGVGRRDRASIHLQQHVPAGQAQRGEDAVTTDAGQKQTVRLTFPRLRHDARPGRRDATLQEPIDRGAPDLVAPGADLANVLACRRVL